MKAMIRYRDYDGPQEGCAVVGGVMYAMNTNVARAISYSAHVLATGLPSELERVDAKEPAVAA